MPKSETIDSCFSYSPGTVSVLVTRVVGTVALSVMGSLGSVGTVSVVGSVAESVNGVSTVGSVAKSVTGVSTVGSVGVVSSVGVVGSVGVFIVIKVELLMGASVIRGAGTDVEALVFMVIATMVVLLAEFGVVMRGVLVTIGLAVLVVDGLTGTIRVVTIVVGTETVVST